MQPVKSYKDLLVWQKSMKLVKNVYLATRKFPQSEVYSLTSQINRAAIAIPSNIAEGYGRKSSKGYNQFLSIAYGSSLELETQFLLATDLGFIDKNTNQEILNSIIEIQKMLSSIISKIKQKTNP